MDESDYQLGNVTSQKGRPIIFYGQKITGTRTRYTITEKELLNIEWTLKELCIILIGQQLRVYTDHKT